MTLPKTHRPGQVERPFKFITFEFPEDRKQHITIEELKVIPDENAFYTGLRQELGQPDVSQDLFVFVHGFNVTFDDAAYRTAQIAYDLGFKGVPVFFSWPSQGSVHEYTYDEANVEWSSRHLRDFLRQLADKSGAKRIHLVAHSMGNRALTLAMEGLAAAALPGPKAPTLWRQRERPPMRGAPRETKRGLRTWSLFAPPVVSLGQATVLQVGASLPNIK